MITYPLTAGQSRIWFADQLAGSNAVYVIPFALRLRGPLNLPALRAGLVALTNRHPMLRVRFVLRSEGPEQYVREVEDVDLQTVDLVNIDATRREGQAMACAMEAIQRPFDLTADPPFRVRLLKLAPHDHMLVMPIHHIVGDGFSLRVLQVGLQACYRQAVLGDLEDPANPDAGYLDFAREEMSPAAETRAREDLGYWINRLEGAPDLLAMPGDRPRPAKPSFAGITARTRLPDTIAAAVEQAARDQKVTPFIVYSAAFSALLARYSGQKDVVVGFAEGGRRVPLSRKIVGLFATTLVQRVDLTAEPTGRELLQIVRAEVAGALAHDRLRFQDLVRERGSHGKIDHHPIFQALIEYVALRPEVLLLSDELSAEPMLIDSGTARFDLELGVRHRANDDDIDLVLKCNADLFDLCSVERMLGHYVALLSSLIADLDLRVSKLPFMTAEEQRQLLSYSRGPVKPYPVDCSLHELIVDQARRTPDRCALQFGARTLSYGDVEHHSRSIAAKLRALGVREDVLVGACMPRRLELVVGLLGILRAGAAYLPLDHEYPQERLSFMVKDAVLDIVLVTRETVQLFEGMSVRLLQLDCLLEQAVHDADIPEIRQSPESLAYVIYTSGSTGTPKAVGNTHRGIVNRLMWMQEAYQLEPSDVVLQKTPMSFDVSVWEFFWPLMCGARLLIAQPGGHRDPFYLRQTIESFDVSVVHFVPTMLRAFMESGGLAGCRRLRLIVCSGEALPLDLRNNVIAAGCDARLENLYGPTEAAVDVSALDCRLPLFRSSVPIGRPIANTQIYVLDAEMQLCALNVIGELYLGGIQLARAYLNRPALTAGQFVPNPFGEPGSRLYRTGDLGRMTADGMIEYVGRADSQIKLRGHRVELGEIESHLSSLPCVSEGVAVHRPSDSGGTIVAYVVAAQDTEPSQQEIRTELEKNLPPIMVPGIIRFIEQMPLLPSGKVNRRSLSKAIDDTEEVIAASAPPQTSTERKLAAAWSATLGIPEVDIDASFFLVGGDSIKSIGFVARAREFGIGLSVQDVFLHGTIRRLALAVTNREAAPDIDEGPLWREEFFDGRSSDYERSSAYEDVYPLSSLLSGLVFESATNKNYQVYVTTVHVRALRSFDEIRMRKSLRSILDQHPFLRSVIDINELGEALQYVHRHPPDPLRLIDLRHLAEPEREQCFAAWWKDERTRPFDWAKPPLLRVTIHHFRDDEFRITLCEPFLDGWSVVLVLSGLLKSYCECSVNSHASPDDSARAYRDFLRSERLALSNAKTREFWQKKLDDAPATQLPRLHVLDAEAQPFDRVTVPISAELSAGILRVANAYRMPIKSVLLAAHARVLSILTGQSEVVTGVMANARPETKSGTDAVGLFLNAILLRIRLSQSPWRTLVNDVHAAEGEALPHRGFPFASMLRVAGLKADQFDATFNYTHFHPYSHLDTADELTIEDIKGTDFTYFPLTAQFRRDAKTSALGLALDFSGRHFASMQRQQIAETYLGVLTELVQQPHGVCVWRPVAPIFEEVEQPLGPDCNSLNALFDRQVRRTPQAVAVVTAEDKWTYSHLQNASMRLIGGLRSRSIGLDSRIVVCLERAPELVALVIAILGVGACYIPVEPDQPEERVVDLIKIAPQPHLVVSSRRVRNRLPNDVPVVLVEELLEASPLGRDTSASTLDRPAYVIFTSGSTGKPKGAIVSQRAVLNRLRWGWQDTPFAANETVCLKTSIGFVDSVAEIFSGLLIGVPTFIVSDDVRDPMALKAALAAGNVSRVTLVPTVLDAMLRIDNGTEPILPHVGCITLSGEPLATRLTNEFLKRRPDARVLNLYGSTEVAADVLFHWVTRHEAQALVSIGEPISGVFAYVLDDFGERLGIGALGELAIGGLAVGTGYLDSPRLTAERFVPDPWRGHGARMYLTGDVVRQESNGSFSFFGRKDRQIKVRGIRIEPAEVEAVLCQQENISSAYVVQRQESGGDLRLVGYVELSDHSGNSADGVDLGRRLRKALSERLLAAAIPDVFYIVENWPRTASGKVNVSALPVPARPNVVEESSSSDGPMTSTESTLADIWGRVLGAGRIERNDDFFDIGGNSLKALMLVARIREQMRLEIPVVHIFDQPTLTDQAKLIEGLLEMAPR